MSQWDAQTAEWYAKRYGEYATNRLAVAALMLPARATIVDIGCGAGSALRHAAAQVTDGVLIGIDPVPRMVEIAREQTAAHPAAERIVYRQGAAERLPVEDAAADFVFAFDSFDHWQDQQSGLKEVRRVLKANGRFVVVKDGGLPAGTKAQRMFLEAIKQAGFKVLQAQAIENAGVAFMMWVCAAT